MSLFCDGIDIQPRSTQVWQEVIINSRRYNTLCLCFLFILIILIFNVKYMQNSKNNIYCIGLLMLQTSAYRISEGIGVSAWVGGLTSHSLTRHTIGHLRERDFPGKWNRLDHEHFHYKISAQSASAVELNHAWSNCNSNCNSLKARHYCHQQLKVYSYAWYYLFKI